MKHLIILPGLLALMAIISCSRPQASGTEPKEDADIDSELNTNDYDDFSPEQYRDTLIGMFNGVEIDTLIAEPIGELQDKDYPVEGCIGWFWDWRVYTSRGTVKDLILKHRTVGIHFVKEGDLDGDGGDDWGYVTEWPTSNWMSYNTFTYCKGSWSRLLQPFSIWLPHIDPDDKTYGNNTPEDLVSKSKKRNHLHIKFSDVRNNGGDFLLVDSLVSIPHKEPVDTLRQNNLNPISK